MLLVNDTKQPFEYVVYRQYGYREDMRTHLLDAGGTQSFAAEITLGSQSTRDHYLTGVLDPDLPVRASFVFEPSTLSSTVAIVLFHYHRGMNNNPDRAVIRDIPVQ